jgi:hypothetical protein
MRRLEAHLKGYPGLRVKTVTSAREAAVGADIVTTVTADKSWATILTPDMIRPGMHINAVGGDCPGKTELHREEYAERGIHAKNLSRVVEDSGTVTANLIPWNSGGAYQAGVLGVATIAYLPFNFFCWLSPLVTLAFGVFNFTITRTDEDPETQLYRPEHASAEPRPSVAGEDPNMTHNEDTMSIVQIIGVPLDLGASRRGTDAGPSALRVAGLGDGLRRTGWDLAIQVDVPVPAMETRHSDSQRLGHAHRQSDPERLRPARSLTINDLRSVCADKQERSQCNRDSGLTGNRD